MLERMLAALFFIGWFPSCFAVQDSDSPKQAARVVSSGDMLNWTVGLLIVLAIFFFCVWGMRKLNGVAVSSAEKMRVVGGLSLGIREKVILLQVGKKQLVLGVTPGRIDTLHVLEGDDCLNQGELSTSKNLDNGFAYHLMQVMKGRVDG
ncbi:MAG: flagellar biosynthetic protein FliO [Methylobacter sp.]|nr:flagellar biosynthetic protein FliO [Methylobacter sp.]